jgi:hypothetical protein
LGYRTWVLKKGGNCIYSEYALSLGKRSGKIQEYLSTIDSDVNLNAKNYFLIKNIKN